MTGEAPVKWRLNRSREKVIRLKPMPTRILHAQGTWLGSLRFRVPGERRALALAPDRRFLLLMVFRADSAVPQLVRDHTRNKYRLRVRYRAT